jgi:hypothetical protein
MRDIENLEEADADFVTNVFETVLPIREVTMTRGPRALEGEVRG